MGLILPNSIDTQGGMARAVAISPNLRCDRACTTPQLLIVRLNRRLVFGVNPLASDVDQFFTRLTSLISIEAPECPAGGFVGLDRQV